MVVVGGWRLVLGRYGPTPPLPVVSGATGSTSGRDATESRPYDHG